MPATKTKTKTKTIYALRGVMRADGPREAGRGRQCLPE